jgi:hypothetical protein
MGVYADLNALARLPRETIDFIPVMPPDIAERFYKEWQRAVRQVLAN